MSNKNDAWRDPKKCVFCGCEDTDLIEECTLDRMEIDGEVRPRIPYTQPFFDSKYRRCHDCGVVGGKFHHPGCDMETCMNCAQQLISCECHISLENVKIPAETLAKLRREDNLQ